MNGHIWWLGLKYVNSHMAFCGLHVGILKSPLRFIILAKQCEVAGKSLILDRCLKKSVSLVYNLGDFLDTHLVLTIFLAT